MRQIHTLIARLYRTFWPLAICLWGQVLGNAFLPLDVRVTVSSILIFTYAGGTLIWIVGDQVFGRAPD